MHKNRKKTLKPNSLAIKIVKLCQSTPRIILFLSSNDIQVHVHVYYFLNQFMLQADKTIVNQNI